MKTLYESILDDEEDISRELREEEIKMWLRENCTIKGTYKIFQKRDIYYVEVKGDIIINNKNIEEFPIKMFYFDRIEGKFDCGYCKKLKSLKGGPRSVTKGFRCIECDKLSSLEGAPGYVGGYFFCGFCNKLTSLEGAPEYVGGDFNCHYCNSLQILKGAPKEICGGFCCNNCPGLKSLEGIPDKIKGDFECSFCTSLTTFEGAPIYVGEDFNSMGCKSVKSLKGLPREIGGNVCITNNVKLLSPGTNIEQEINKISRVKGKILYNTNY